MENGRSADQIREHYDIERKLADRLRKADRAERRALYTTVYEDLYRLVPHHPQLARKGSKDRQKAATKNSLKLLHGFLHPHTVFLEVGPGDCALVFEVAGKVKKACGVDVAPSVADLSRAPDNFEYIVSDGSSIPVPPASIDLAFSNQLMEHLHPEDAIDQLRNIFRSLADGGAYLCVTPNRLFGPHDISKYFDHTATGLHLREYTVSELAGLFRQAGFRKIRVCLGGRGVYLYFPLLPALLLEFMLRLVPAGIRRVLAANRLLGGFVPVRMLGVKSR